jgi:hypothetical protein
MADTAPTKKTRHRIPDSTWAAMEKKACAGISLQSLADAFEISLATVNDRSKRFGWKTPGRLARRRAAESAKAAPAKAKRPVAAIGGTGNDSRLAVPDCLTAFQAMVDAPPAAFQAALVPVLQGLLARALRNVPEARTLSDVKTLADMHRRASGMDAKEWRGDGMPLVMPLRSLRRRPPVVEAVACDA